MATIRVLNDGPGPGALNMARDEALLVLVGQGVSPPTLRLYQWSPPTISLGYFQSYDDYLALPPPAGGLPVVRRLTGGGAILHDRELTYSLTLPAEHPLVAGAPNRLYELVHDALIACLREGGVETHRSGRTDGSTPARGPFFCFARRHRFDVLVGIEKVAGSAQRRTRQAVLQHGSVIVGRRFDQQPSAALGDRGPSIAWLRSHLPAALAVRAALTCTAGAWAAVELELVRALCDKYASIEWTRGRTRKRAISGQA